MIVMFIIGSSSLMVMGLEAKMDIWIAILLAIGVGTLIMMMYARILSALPGKDFFEIVEYYLGKVGSKIAIFLITWFCFDLCAIVLRNYAQFIVTVGLPETPLVAAMFILIVVSMMASKNGVETISRWTENFSLYVVGFMVISLALVAKNMNFSNLVPILEGGVEPIARGAFAVVAFPFAELVTMLLVFPAFKTQSTAKKVFVKGLLIGGTIILITSVADILVLGTSVAENKYYPTYSTMATVNYGDFFQRLEILAAIVFVIAVFFKITILLYGASNGAARLMGFKNPRFIIIPIAFLIINFSVFGFTSMIDYHEWTFKVFPYYSFIFEIIVPIVLLIIIKVKQRKNKKKVPS